MAKHTQREELPAVESAAAGPDLAGELAALAQALGLPADAPAADVVVGARAVVAECRHLLGLGATGNWNELAAACSRRSQ